MMSFDELRQAEGELKSRIEHLHEFLHIDERREEMAELEKKMAAPDFWNDKESAQNTVSQLSACRNLVEPFRRLESEVEDYAVALELAGEDEEFLKEAEIAYRRLLKSLDRMEIMSFLSGKFDRNNLYFSIHAGAGGTESCDWANMLLRMYRRFFERRGWKDEVIDLQPGEQLLDGDKAMQLIRWRKNNVYPWEINAAREAGFDGSDIKRTQMQQQFIVEAAKQILQVKNLKYLGSMVEVFKENVETDLSIGNLAWFAQKALELDSANKVTFHSLPGKRYAHVRYKVFERGIF